MKRLLLAPMVLALALATPLTAHATLMASANFSASGGNLTITLTNTSPDDVGIPAELLSAVFFDITGQSGNLTPVSALLWNDSSVLFGADGGGNVGGEFAFKSGIGASTPNGAAYGVSSSGFSIFGAFNFNGPDLNSQAAVDGMGYNITSAGDNPATGNAAVTGANPLIQNSVRFVLSGYNGTGISNVWLQYGTALTEPGGPGSCTNGNCDFTLPDGGTTAALLGLSMLGLGFLRRLKG